MAALAACSSLLGQQVPVKQRQAGSAQPPSAPVVCALRRSHKLAARTPSSGGFLQQQQLAARRQVRSADAAPASSGSVGSGWMDMPESQPVEEAAPVFPRLKERDPYKRLGVSRDASFEEVQEARNFLVEQYNRHEPSRESIELALDAILQEKMKVRHREGFRPPTRGRRGEAQGDAPRLSLWERVRSYFEPSVPATTLVNDGSVFVALGVWAAWTAAASDPTLPLGAALAFAAWKLYDKRNKRNPDGPFWGGNPMWGALGATVLSLIIGSILAYALVNVVPMPPRLASEAVGLFLITMILGFTAIFLK